MSAELEPVVHIEWIVAPDLEDEWLCIEACVASPQPVEPPPVREDEWWPGRCIP